MYDLAVVVPARRGSSRIANKSMLPFGDASSLIEWKLNQLRKVIDPARIYLSSEDEEFLAIARSLGVSQHKRDQRLATGHIVPMSEVITGVVRDIPHKHIAWATVVCPLMPPREYIECFRSYGDHVVNGSYDSLLGVNSMKEYFWFKGRPLNYQADRKHISSQDLPSIEKVTNSIYMCSRDQILETEYLVGPNPLLQSLSRLSGVDIDYWEDYRTARALYELYLEDRLDEVEESQRIAWTPQE